MIWLAMTTTTQDSVTGSLPSIFYWLKFQLVTIVINLQICIDVQIDFTRLIQ